MEDGVHRMAGQQQPDHAPAVLPRLSCRAADASSRGSEPREATAGLPPGLTKQRSPSMTVEGFVSRPSPPRPLYRTRLPFVAPREDFALATCALTSMPSRACMNAFSTSLIRV